MSLRPAKATSHSSPSPRCYSREVRGAKQMYEKHKSRQRTLDAPLAGSWSTNVSRPVILSRYHPHHSSAALRTGQRQLMQHQPPQTQCSYFHTTRYSHLESPVLSRSHQATRGTFQTQQSWSAQRVSNHLFQVRKVSPGPMGSGDSSLPPISQCQEMLFSMANDNPQKTSTRVQKTSLK